MSAKHDLASLARTPNSLAAHYSRFRVADRLLLTGHSHQAWPDAGFEGQRAAWDDAAEFVDDKWGHAFEKADRVRAGFASLLDDDPSRIALGSNTHELILRVLSALPLDRRPRLVTTDGEFHTLRRQLDRLAEAPWFEVVKVAAEPVDTLAARLAAAADDRTAAVFVSSVLFGSARIVPGLPEVQRACARVGAELVVDTYHHLNVVPFSVRESGLGAAFLVGGGYKYCQLGEGNCFLRVPPETALFPIVTGWYSEFARLAERPTGGVPFGEGAERWAGATYDPTSHYRAACVFDFLAREGLVPTFLREVSLHQVGHLAAAFDALDLDSATITRDRTTAPSEIAGFLALTAPRAGEISTALRRHGVWTDTRGTTLRFGPAPYLDDAQLDRAIAALGEVVRDAGQA